MGVKEHYQNHLGNFYSWMAGDFATLQQAQQQFFAANGIVPQTDADVAVDLGAGHGLQAVSLAKLGFVVKAIDFNPQLLAELSQNAQGLPIEIVEGDITQFAQYVPKANVVVCMGDTISHLQSFETLQQLFAQIYAVLPQGGKLVLSYRDYSTALEDTQRILPVRADENRIHTCLLEYFDDTVRVTDILHQNTNGAWQQSASSYYKLRISAPKITALLQQQGFSVQPAQTVQRMVYSIATK